jgi:AraC-like DNA-binding protein
MIIPRREHRSVAVVPLSGTCLSGGLTSLAVVDEAVLAGLNEKPKLKPLVIHATLRGTRRYSEQGGSGKEVVCAPGTLAAIAGGRRWRSEITGSEPCHSLYLMMEGPWASRLDLDLSRVQGGICDPAPPSAPVQAVQQVVQLGLGRPDNWDWMALTAIGRICTHLAQLCQRGGGSLAEQVGNLIDATPDAAWSLAQLAKLFGLSPSAFVHRFRSEACDGPASWIRRRRMNAARRMLELGQRPGEVARAMGFRTLGQFSRTYKATLGSRPSDCRAQG